MSASALRYVLVTRFRNRARSFVGGLARPKNLLALLMGALNEYLTRDARNATRRAGEDMRDWVSSAERERETVGSLKTIGSLARRWADKGVHWIQLGCDFEYLVRDARSLFAPWRGDR